MLIKLLWLYYGTYFYIIVDYTRDVYVLYFYRRGAS
jgi:hypothetical protein